MRLLIVLLTLTTAISADAGNATESAVSERTKAEIRDMVLRREKEIQNLTLSFTRTSKWDDGDETYRGYEWAMSGDKRFRLLRYPVPVGQPLSERTGTAVWNGKTISAYDSELDNGSLGIEFDPHHQDASPSTWTPYNNFLGDTNRGTLGHLMTVIPLDGWDIARKNVEGRNLAVLSTNRQQGRVNENRLNSWTIDLDRGGMIIQSTDWVRRDPSEYPPDG